MGRFETDHIKQIRAQIDIVDYIGRHVNLRAAGKNFVGLCPFHDERTPSFQVHQEKQFYHCFGCQAGGDIFEFVMEHERLTFREAVVMLAQEAGVDLPESSRPVDPAEEEKRQQTRMLLQANRVAADFYHNNLFSPLSKIAVDYLRHRRIGRNMVEMYKVGYAPPRWDALLAELDRHGISPQMAVKAGLASERDDGQPFDMFRNRLMFPITDARGNVVGFGGRSLQDDGPKYINTPQTDLFIKREQLYGFPQAGKAARSEGFLIVCEGYTDVIALVQAGIRNVVASLGTAFTLEQSKMLGRWTKEVVLAFDADAAGRSATDRGLDALTEAGLNVRVATLSDGMDPDQFVREYGKQKMTQAIAAALPLMDYKIEQVLRDADLATIGGRARAVEQALPILATVESAVAREGYIARIADETGSSSQAIETEIQRYLRQRGRRTDARHRNSSNRYTTTSGPDWTESGGMAAGSGPPPLPPPPDMPPVHMPEQYGEPPDMPVQTGGTRPADRQHEYAGLKGIAAADVQKVLWLLQQSPTQAVAVRALLGKEPFGVGDDDAVFQALCAMAENDAVPSNPDIEARLQSLKAWNPGVVLDLDTYVDSMWRHQIRDRLHQLAQYLERLPERVDNAYAERVGHLLVSYHNIQRDVRRRRSPQ